MDWPHAAHVAVLEMEAGYCLASIIHHLQQAYFAAENASNDASASTILIEFMKALIDRIEPPEKPSTILRF